MADPNELGQIPSVDKRQGQENEQRERVVACGNEWLGGNAAVGTVQTGSVQVK